MKKLQSWALLILIAVASFACDDNDSSNPVTPKTEFKVTEANGMTEVEGSTAQDFTFSASKKYLLKGFVYVQSGATLTIEPGTIIKGDKASKATLIIERGGKIMAEGTSSKPIVFTSAQVKGSRKSGDWGGIILLGDAPINLPNGTGKIEGGVDREYGGTNATDNSGSLKYIRIEFGGIAFQPDNEINGLTLGGVGSGTTLDYIQVSHSGDDSFEWFGGTVNAKHLVAYKTVDDMFDTDNGFSGKLQFLVGMSDPAVADVSGSNGFESDNDAQGSAATPKTSATFSNVSLFGPKANPEAAATDYNSNFKRGMHIRRNSSISVYNTLVAGWPTGLLLDDQSGNSSTTEANATSGSLKIKNVVIAGSGSKALTVFAGDATVTPNKPASTFDLAAFFNATGNNNSLIADYATLNLLNAFNQTAPNFLPAAGSVLLTTGATTGLDPFFENANYVGAFGTTDWTAGWTNWNANEVEY
ncbi:T9SS C-terminal target domain-containing protein [Adhaeribacter radiodurans]|uniref:T9SS C-terminal target domain-containing protein n=1 Tax=Adhaeribacter radiodurans TaxID=2745197 RepID=A0A7L7L2C5_9BACT|nr:T9SS C-terminal target domain-containing protein [Adhaeribacter radiodurans]QMU26947.1 T9SS C-terminal target domain-containing protein [Adhaeribacter radiodurans]